ncbi:MAG: phasin family protein [Hyphomicrobiales bacterium]|nr:phasin family protein [Hyphomicrobiales bacterium]
MQNAFDDFQKFGKDNVDVAVKSADAVNKGIQALATEAAGYSKHSFEAGASAMGQLFSAGSIDKAMEVQAEYLRSAYEGYVGQATRVSEIVTDMAKDAYQPYQSLFAKVGR